MKTRGKAQLNYLHALEPPPKLSYIKFDLISPSPNFHPNCPRLKLSYLSVLQPPPQLFKAEVELSPHPQPPTKLSKAKVELSVSPHPHPPPKLSYVKLELSPHLQPPPRLSKQCGITTVKTKGCRGSCASYSQTDPRNTTNIVHKCR